MCRGSISVPDVAAGLAPPAIGSFLVAAYPAQSGHGNRVAALITAQVKGEVGGAAAQTAAVIGHGVSRAAELHVRVVETLACNGVCVTVNYEHLARGVYPHCSCHACGKSVIARLGKAGTGLPGGGFHCRRVEHPAGA